MQNQLTDQKPMGQWVELNYQTKENETVALHLAIDPETFKKLKHNDDSTLTLEKMKEKGATDEKIQCVYQKCESYLANLNSRKKTYRNIKISIHKFDIFRSKHSFTTLKGKYVFLIGDAESVVALERGVNKGLKGAAICAYLVNALLSSGKLDSIFFENYAEAIKDIFDKANEWTPAKEPAPPANCCVLI